MMRQRIPTTSVSQEPAVEAGVSEDVLESFNSCPDNSNVDVTLTMHLTMSNERQIFPDKTVLDSGTILRNVK